MGIQQSQQPNPSSSSFNINEWNEVYYDSGSRVLAHKHNHHFQIQQHSIVISNQRDLELAKQLFALRRQNQFLAGVLHYQIFQHKRNDVYTGLLYTERMPMRLPHIKPVCFPDILHMYAQAIYGFQKLSTYFNYFKVNENCIGVNCQTIVKVWHNPNFASIYPFQSTYNQQEMILSIIDAIQPFVDQSTMPAEDPSFKNFVLRQCNNLNFDHLKRRLFQYSSIFNKGSIPKKLQQIQPSKRTGVQNILNPYQNQLSYKSTPPPQQILHNSLVSTNRSNYLDRNMPLLSVSNASRNIYETHMPANISIQNHHPANLIGGHNIQPRIIPIVPQPHQISQPVIFFPLAAHQIPHSSQHLLLNQPNSNITNYPNPHPQYGNHITKQPLHYHNNRMMHEQDRYESKPASIIHRPPTENHNINPIYTVPHNGQTVNNSQHQLNYGHARQKSGKFQRSSASSQSDYSQFHNHFANIQIIQDRNKPLSTPLNARFPRSASAQGHISIQQKKPISTRQRSHSQLKSIFNPLHSQPLPYPNPNPNPNPTNYSFNLGISNMGAPIMMHSSYPAHRQLKPMDIKRSIVGSTRATTHIVNPNPNFNHHNHPQHFSHPNNNLNNHPNININTITNSNSYVGNFITDSRVGANLTVSIITPIEQLPMKQSFVHHLPLKRSNDQILRYRQSKPVIVINSDREPCFNIPSPRLLELNEVISQRHSPPIFEDPPLISTGSPSQTQTQNKKMQESQNFHEQTPKLTNRVSSKQQIDQQQHRDIINPNFFNEMPTKFDKFKQKQFNDISISNSFSTIGAPPFHNNNNNNNNKQSNQKIFYDIRQTQSVNNSIKNFYSNFSADDYSQVVDLSTPLDFRLSNKEKNQFTRIQPEYDNCDVMDEKYMTNSKELKEEKLGTTSLDLMQKLRITQTINKQQDTFDRYQLNKHQQRQRQKQPANPKQQQKKPRSASKQFNKDLEKLGFRMHSQESSSNQAQTPTQRSRIDQSLFDKRQVKAWTPTYTELSPIQPTFRKKEQPSTYEQLLQSYNYSNYVRSKENKINYKTEQKYYGNGNGSNNATYGNSNQLNKSGMYSSHYGSNYQPQYEYMSKTQYWPHRDTQVKLQQFKYKSFKPENTNANANINISTLSPSYEKNAMQQFQDYKFEWDPQILADLQSKKYQKEIYD